MSKKTTLSVKKLGMAPAARKVTMTAMLAAISYIMAFAEFPVPFSPSFARMDLSDFPALVGAFAFGPSIGVMMELVKNGLQLLSTSTGGVGELANFLMGSSYVLTAGLIYKWNKTKKTAIISLITGSVVMGITAAAANYFLLLPMFEAFTPLDQIIYSSHYFFQLHWIKVVKNPLNAKALLNVHPSSGIM